MKKVIKTNNIPDHSIIINGFSSFHYCDLLSVVTKTNDSLDNITTRIFQPRRWTDMLMRIRNAVAHMVGLDSGGYKKNMNIADYYPIGSRAIYFTVIDRNKNEKVMAENDIGFNFRVSVILNRDEDDTIIRLTTLVKYNNALGRLYFIQVKPFHRMIVMSLLERLVKYCVFFRFGLFYFTR